MYYFYNRTGGALKTQLCLDDLPTVSLEDTVHDAVDYSHRDPESTDIPPQTDVESVTPQTAGKTPATLKVLVEDDVIGHPASITYHDCLKQLADYLVLPVNMCPAKDPNTKVECRAPRPFETNVKSRGTAAIIEWVSLSFTSIFIP